MPEEFEDLVSRCLDGDSSEEAMRALAEALKDPANMDRFIWSAKLHGALYDLARSKKAASELPRTAVAQIEPPVGSTGAPGGDRRPAGASEARPSRALALRYLAPPMGAAAAALLLLGYLGFKKAPRGLCAEILRIEGPVQLMVGDSRRPARSGDVVEPGRGVHTGPGARVTLGYPDGTTIEVAEDTVISLEKDRKAKRISLDRGGLRARVAKQPAGRPMVLATPQAEVEVLGTRFSLSVKVDSTRLEVEEGKVRMTRRYDGASVEVTKGHYAVAARGVALAAMLISGAAASDWPQAAANAARTGHVDDEPRPPYTRVWTKWWDRERLPHTNQPIIVGGAVYIASGNGIVHAVDAATGKGLWDTDIGAGVIHTLAGDDARIYAAALDGCVYALDRRNKGRIVWRTPLSRRGFSGAPLLMDGVVYAGSRDGKMYAVRADGEKLWEWDTGAPIVQTPAGANGRVVVTNDSMTVFCFDAKGGPPRWTKPIIWGGGVYQYWPLIHKGKVIIRTNVPGTVALVKHATLLKQKYEKKGFRAKSAADIVAEQSINIEYYKEHPELRTFHVLNLDDGKEPYIASVVGGCVNNGPYPPPCVAGDGQVYTPFKTSAGRPGHGGQFVGIVREALGRFDVETGRIAEPLVCAWGDKGLRGIVGGPNCPFELTSDETVTMTSGGNIIFGMRWPCRPGAIDVSTRKAASVPSSDAGPIVNGSNLCRGTFIAVSGKFLAYTQGSRLVCVRGQ